MRFADFLIRRRGFIVALTCMLAALWSAGASAVTVLLTDDREIFHNGVTHAPSPAFSPYSQDVFAFEAGAGQTSSVDTQGAVGSGYAYAGIDTYLYGSSGRSTFDIAFELTAASAFDLSGLVSIEEGSGFLATLTLYQGAAVLWSFTASQDTAEQVPFDVSGVLSAGTYRLVAEATALPFQYGFDSGYTGASYSFAFVVPEPGSAWLVSLGLLSLALRSFRR